MSLQIHRAERADRLARALGDLLSDPLDDPFTTEIVSVPTRGVERWLAQQLSHRLGISGDRADGVCAGVSFPSPRRLLHAVVARALYRDPSSTSDPWQPDRAVWPLLSVIDASRGEPWARLLWTYLGDTSQTDTSQIDTSQTDPPSATPSDAGLDPVRAGRRWATARHLAELFARYAGGRPTMIRYWQQGRDLDAAGRPLPADLAWQAELWRRLLGELDAPSPVDELDAAVARICDDPSSTGLPARLSLFGATRLDPEHLRMLDALARHRNVHLWLPHPSPALWRTLDHQLSRTPRRVGPRSDDRTADLARHRLLAYLGRDSRELQLTLHARATIGADDHLATRSTEPEHTSVLARLQDDLAANRPPVGYDELPQLEPTDRSVQIHASHGPDRQVEVLREVLVGLLADDATLEPRDIVVMCPDIERFAPLISAAFGLDADDAAAEHPGHRLRVRLADRSLRQLNPLLSVLSRVLDLADGRMTASDLLDLCALPPVARKFGFGEDDLERLTQLVGQAGVRWGLDAAHRQPYGMEAFGQNTWAAGLDRLLLGVTMDEEGEHFIGTALPLDDVDSSDVDLVGRLAELVDRVRVACDAFRPRHPLADWIRHGRAAVEALTAVTPKETWQVTHAYAELGRLAEAADDDETTPLSLAEMRGLLSEAFRGRASRANFRTGTLTMCTMHPMRSIPHRVVCLLGVDDGVFPRRARPDGDDILATEEWVGDRDPRSEDRQLLLDAIMAAEDHLVVIYAGADPRTGARRPPAVPIGELLDAIELTVRAADGRPVREHLTVRHRLQPFDPGNFAADTLVPGRSFSFDPAALRGALAAMRPRQSVTSPYAVGLLPPPDLGEVITLTDLTRFFAHPPRALLRARAGLSTFVEDVTSLDQLPVTLDGLEQWDVGERMLHRYLNGAELDQLIGAEWRRGTVPPQAFGQQALGPVVERVRSLADAARPHLAGEPTSRDVELRLGGRLLSGTVTPIHGTAFVTISYSTLSAKQRLVSWLSLLALSAAHRGTEWGAVTVARRGTSILGPLDGEWAERVLTDLVDLYLTGLRGPIPFMPRTSAAYAEVRFDGRSIGNERDHLIETWNRDSDITWRRVLGGRARLEDLMAQPSVTAEERGDLAEPSRFGTLARRVFHPLLKAEQRS